MREEEQSDEADNVLEAVHSESLRTPCEKDAGGGGGCGRERSYRPCGAFERLSTSRPANGVGGESLLVGTHVRSSAVSRMFSRDLSLLLLWSWERGERSRRERTPLSCPIGSRLRGGDGARSALLLSAALGDIGRGGRIEFKSRRPTLKEGSFTTVSSPGR